MSHTYKPLHYVTWESPLGPVQLWGSPSGLVRLSFLDGLHEQRTDRWVQRHCGAIAPVESSSDEPLFAAAIAQLRAYFAGERHAFDVPLDLHGTPFQLAVWHALLAIPWGVTRSYRSIAQEIGRPLAVRAVGAANGANPISIIVPCHRLRAADGSLRAYGGGLQRKAQLLALETTQVHML